MRRSVFNRFLREIPNDVQSGKYGVDEQHQSSERVGSFDKSNHSKSKRSLKTDLGKINFGTFYTRHDYGFIRNLLTRPRQPIGFPISHGIDDHLIGFAIAVYSRNDN